MPKIRFTKMHGCGNDYIYVNAMEHPIADPSAAAILWSDRHKGIGSDGLVLIDRSPVPEADFSMRIFNADGSEAMMCGNASRCIGKYLYDRGLTTKTTIRLLTLSGVKILQLHLAPPLSTAQPLPSLQGEGCPKGGVGSVTSVTVDMGEPVLEDERLFRPGLAASLSTPLPHRERLRVGEPCSGMGQGAGSALFVSMGNPHYVIFTDDVDQVGETGRALEHHPAFPQRCNIEFVAPLLSPLGGKTDSHANDTSPRGEDGRGLFRVRVWERGSGITQACGTGACATAVAACLTGRAGRESDIIMDGGTLHIEWRESDNHVYMTGPAAFVFDGEMEAPLNPPLGGNR